MAWSEFRTSVPPEVMQPRMIAYLSDALDALPEEERDRRSVP